MADTKITALTAIGANPIIPSTFPIPMVDLTDTSMAASGTTKKVTVNQILQAGGTATLASATITGDLTVDTSTLKVDSTNDRVGIQITSPTAPLEVGETSGTALRLRRLTSGNTIDVNFYNTNTTVGDVAGIRCDGDGLANTYGAISFWTTQTPNSLVERYRISSVGVHTWQNVGGVAGTAMTLNSTGLGVGVSPAYKGDFNGNIRSMKQGSRADLAFLIDGNASPSWQQRNVIGHYYNGAQDCISLRVPSSAITNTGSYDIGANGTHWWYSSAGTTATGSTGTPTMTLDASGNLSLQSDKYLGWGNLDSLIYGSSTSNYIYFRTNATERVRVKSGGQVRFVPLAADPAGAEAGDVYYNSSSNKLKCYNGTTWNDLF